ncbi:hypothetical protein NDA13_003903 [Ustilago tritici]|nr:hypothetical protein NDA13_003903 [Ustilago tritici]
MTRASTSAANFGLLLVALVLMLHSVVGELTPKHVRHHLFARQNEYFTIERAGDPFNIWYPNLGEVEFYYYNYNHSTGCKDIKLKRGNNSAWRIWVSDEDGNGKDIDTMNYVETT